MKENTKKRKKARVGMEEALGKQEILNQMYEIYAKGKAGFDVYMKEMGRMSETRLYEMAETIMYIDREEISGPDYNPYNSEIQKWASQGGSVYIGDQKIKVEHPRLRGPEGEIALKSYEKLKERGQFSEELLNKVLRGISSRKYAETVVDAAGAFGVSPSTVSRYIVEATAKQMREFKERELSKYEPFAIFLDTIHRGGEAFIIGLGINTEGIKKVLGFWQGATENHEICEELFGDIERRGLEMSRHIIWITDGGKGIIKALRKRFGKKLIHQRCTIHKDKNIQRHLAKKYRREAHRRFRTALEQNSYENARQMLGEMEKWLRSINESAADSLMEAIDEILTVHKLEVPGLLRKTLHSTNPIESMFSKVRDAERNIKRYRNSKMMQRWLASVLIYSEKGFRRIKGHASIPEVIKNIKSIDTSDKVDRKAA